MHRQAPAGVLSDIQTNFNYPSENNVYRQVTFVQIVADQTSVKGSAGITQGGIGSNHVSAVVYASSTLYLNTTFSVYGLTY